MSSTYDYGKVKKTVRINWAIQAVLILILGYMMVKFQSTLQGVGRGGNFINAVIAAFILELLFFYPIFKFASGQVKRDLAATGSNLSADQVKSLTRKARVADAAKAAVVAFYVVFLWAVPRDPVVLSLIFFSFLLTLLTYFQCYNFSAKRELRR